MGDYIDHKTDSTGVNPTDNREEPQTGAGAYRGVSGTEKSARFNPEARYTGRPVPTEQILHEKPQSALGTLPGKPHSVQRSEAQSAAECTSKWNGTSYYTEVSERAGLRHKETHDTGTVTEHVGASSAYPADQAGKNTPARAQAGLALAEDNDTPAVTSPTVSTGDIGDHSPEQPELNGKHAEGVSIGYGISDYAANSKPTGAKSKETHDTDAVAEHVGASSAYPADQAGKNTPVRAQAGLALAEDSDTPAAVAPPVSTEDIGDHNPEQLELIGKHAEDASIGYGTSEPAGLKSKETHDTDASADHVHTYTPHSTDQAVKNTQVPDHLERRDEPAAAASSVSTRDDAGNTAENPERTDEVVSKKSDDTEYAALAASARLWKYKGVPFTEPDRTRDRISNTLTYDGGRAVGARVRGKSHKHAGSSCDDWFEMNNEGDILFVAVSDGAGSRRFSRVGSKTACETAVAQMKAGFSSLTDTEEKRKRILDSLSEPLDSEAFRTAAGTVALILQDSVLKAIEAVKLAFEKRKTDPRYNTGDRQLELGDLACTLLVAAAVPLDNGEHFMLSCQIGDGAVVSIDTKGPYPEKVRILGTADSGEYTGQTEFITSHEFAEPADLIDRTKVSRARCDLMMVMTDGVADDYYPGSKRMTELYYDLIANGILSRPSDTECSSVGSTELETDLPLTFPWVDNQDTQVSLNYADRICAKNRIELKDLWGRRDVLARAAEQVASSLGDTDAERLEMWLDNYVRRSSYDDRTLVVMMLDGREENG